MQDFKKTGLKILSLNFFLPGVTAESEFSNFMIKYLDKIETEFENILAFLPGPQMGTNQDKIEVENRVTYSL